MPAGSCNAPNAPTGLTLTPGGTSIDVSFASSTTGVATDRFDVRYSDTPIDDSNFNQANPSDMTPPPPGAQGSAVSTTISGLKPQQKYYVAVRAFSTCERAVAGGGGLGARRRRRSSRCCTAASSPPPPTAPRWPRSSTRCARVRDRALITNPLGRLAVAGYYAMSPPIARAITADERLRAGARKLLAPIVDVAEAGLRAADRAR